jgi:hypothetical protein
LGVVLPAEGGAAEGGGQQGPDPQGTAGRGEVADQRGLPGHAPVWSRQLRRQNVISKPDDKSPTGVSTVQDFFVGKTAKDYAFDKPCFL